MVCEVDLCRRRWMLYLERRASIPDGVMHVVPQLSALSDRFTVFISICILLQTLIELVRAVQ